MYRRPLSIGTIGACLLCYGGLAFVLALRTMFLADDDELSKITDSTGIPGIVVLGINVGVAMITFICGVNILNGANWSRWFYSLTCVIIVGYDFFYYTNMYMLVAGAIWRLIAIIFLFLPDSTEYFHSESGLKKP